MKKAILIIGVLFCLTCEYAFAQSLVSKDKFTYKENAELSAQERKLLLRMAVEEGAVEKDKTIYAWEYVARWLMKCDRSNDLRWSECICPQCHEHLVMFFVREYYTIGPSDTHYHDNVDLILFICPHCRSIKEICLIK